MLVIGYAMVYYRGLGIVAVGSLVVATYINLFAFALLSEWIGFTLTLAGIAGAIVSIGITADSFVLYFERLRDEVREGKSIKTAVETAWVRARRTIVVSDVVSLIAAVLLYIFAVGGVRGFAFTLGLSTLIDLLVVFFFSKPLVVLLSRMAYFQKGARFSGMSRRSLGLKPEPEEVANGRTV
jgi:preprotein translocase subunit SecD